MASNDFATIAAATAAGYTYAASTMADALTVKVTLDKPVVGFSGSAGGRMKAVGYALTLALATGKALAALNDQRSTRYGYDVGSLNKSRVDAVASTLDVS
jgi:hypothetical protein